MAAEHEWDQTLSLEDVTDTSAWQSKIETVENIDTKQIEIFKSSGEVDPIFSSYEDIEDAAKPLNEDNQVIIDLPGHPGKTVTVHPDGAEIMESLIQNSPSFVEKVARSLSSTGDDSLTIHSAGPDVPPGLLGSAGVGFSDVDIDVKNEGIHGIDMLADQAVMMVNFDSMKEHLDAFAPDPKPSTPEEKEAAIHQLYASTIIHELGHIDGSLGAAEDCCGHDAFTLTSGGHDHEHSRYIMSTMNEWLENTNQEPIKRL